MMIRGLERIRQAWCRHPIIDGVTCGVACFIASTLIVAFVLPAWAVIIPLPGRYTIDLGDLPPWIAAVVAGLVYWEARKAKKHAAEAAMTAKTISVQVDGLLTQRDKDKVAEGEKKGKQAGEEAAHQLAEGQRQGREAERESVAAKGAGDKLLSASEGQPLPVADDRTAKAGERVADATERAAAATERATTATEENK